MASRQDQQPRHQPLEVGGLVLTSSTTHYVVISSAKNPHKRFCVRLIMDQDNSNVSLLAHSRDCPSEANHNNNNDDGLNPSTTWAQTRTPTDNTWSFNLTRQSKYSFQFLDSTLFDLAIFHARSIKLLRCWANCGII